MRLVGLLGTYYAEFGVLIDAPTFRGSVYKRSILPYFGQVCNPQASILIVHGNLTVPAASNLEEEPIEIPLLRY